MSRVMSLCVGRTAHATGSIALLPGRSCRWSGRHLGPAVVRSGPTEYVSGPLGNSDLLRRLAAEQKAKEDAERGEKRRKGTATSVVSTEVVAKAGSPDPTFDVVTYIDEEEDDDEDDGAELLSELSDEGWQADIIDDDTVVRVSLHRGHRGMRLYESVVFRRGALFSICDRIPCSAHCLRNRSRFWRSIWKTTGNRRKEIWYAGHSFSVVYFRPV